MTDYEPLDAPKESASGLSAMLLPVVSVFVSGVGGIALGLLGASLFMSPKTELVEVLRNYSPDELANACQPLTEAVLTDLEEAEERVVSLGDRVKAKETEVNALEAEMKRRGKKGAALVKALKSAQSELKSLETRLVRAVQEKKQLQVELTSTKEHLKDQKVLTKVAKEDALDFKWRDFTGNSQLAICERGNRKKLGRCRETVLDTLNGALKQKFAFCIRSDQSVPIIKEIGKNGKLPQFAEYLNQESRITRGWYILLCDPTLPEATGYQAPLPTNLSSSNADIFGEFDDLDD